MPSKEIPSVDGEPLKETKKMPEDKNDKQVRTSTGGPLKKRDIPRHKKGKWVSTYSDLVSTGKF